MEGDRRLPFREIELLEDVQRHQGCDPLTVRRDLTDLIASVPEPDRLYPQRAECGEVLIAEITAVFPALPVYLPCSLAPVKGLCAGLSYSPQGRRVIGKSRHLPYLRRPALRCEGPEPRFEFRSPERLTEAFEGRRPGKRQLRRYGETLLRISDGRCELIPKRELSEPRRKCLPRSRRTGNVDRGPSPFRHPVSRGGIIGTHLIRRDRQRRRAAGIQTEELLFLFRPDDGESIRADSVGTGLRHGQSRSSRHCGVNGIASPAQDLQACRGSLRRRSVYHAAPRIKRVAARRIALRQGIKGRMHGISFRDGESSARLFLLFYHFPDSSAIDPYGKACISRRLPLYWMKRPG